MIPNRSPTAPAEPHRWNRRRISVIIAGRAENENSPDKSPIKGGPMTGKSRVETGGQQRGQRESSMSHQERLEALKTRHQALETAIAEEHAHSHPDEVRISNL